MSKRGANMFELIFTAFFILKATKTGVVEDWSWWLIVLPLVINFVVKFFSWIVDTLGIKRSADVAIQDFYVSRIRQKAIEKAKKEFLK